MKVIVAICTFNRAELLRQTLTQMRRLLIPKDVVVEFVVVNNCCTDETDSVINEAKDWLPLRMIYEIKPGLSQARNAALASADGDYIVFTDDDVLVDEQWLFEFARAARAFPQAAVIGGPIQPWFPIEPDPELLEAFPELRAGFCGVDHQCDAGPLSSDRTLNGASMAFRVAALGDLRFNPLLGPIASAPGGGDETEFIRRIRAKGGEVVWWPPMFVKHYVDPSRMTHAYLLEFMKSKGVSFVSTPAPERKLTGRVPLWLWRRFVEAHSRYLTSLLLPTAILRDTSTFMGAIPRNASRRVRSLALQRECYFLRGMLRGHRQNATAR